MKPETDILLDLMIARALTGLNEADQEQLDRTLMAMNADQIALLEQQLETALAMAGDASALDEESKGAAPAAVIRALEQDADRFFGITGDASQEPGDVARHSSVTTLRPRAMPGIDTADGPAGPRDGNPGRAGHSRGPGASPGRFAWAGWAVAALLLMTIWVGRPDVGTDSAPLAPNDARTILLGLNDTTQIPWGESAWADYAGVRGDVVWNDARQEGYLRLSNMPANDPAEAQYQLWIVDPGRDEEPVDGGVFDVPPGVREVVVPIRAKLGVRSPAAFAITREQPGGVVVSEGPLLVVASRG